MNGPDSISSNPPLVSDRWRFPTFAGLVATRLLRFSVAHPAWVTFLAVAILFFFRWLALPISTAMQARVDVVPNAIGHIIELSLNVAAIAIVAMPLQLLWPAIDRRPKVSTREFWLDVIYWHQGLLLNLLSIYALIVAFEDWLWSWSSRPWLPWLANVPSWGQVLVAVWLYDLVAYWRHRSEHMVSPLWSFHAVHHSTKQVDVLTTLRLHPIEIIYATITNSIVVVIGIDVNSAATAYAIYTFWNYFIHTNVRVRFSGPMKYVLVTPFMHQWHHAVNDAAIGKNIGVVFAWNDWLFGTAYHPVDWPMHFGIDDSSNAPISSTNYWNQLTYPCRFAWARCRKK